MTFPVIYLQEDNILRWLDIVFFSGPYLYHFQSAFHQPSLRLMDVQITPVVGKGLKFG